MKVILKITFLFICSVSLGQNNLLDTSTWTVGTGDVNGFNVYGPTAENERIVGVDPLGNLSVIWMSKPDSATSKDGGYYSSYHAIDPTKTYRLTTWIKKTGSASGSSYFGLNSQNSGVYTSLRFDGTVNSNPYFWSGDLPELDKWYLVVGFIHPNPYSGSYQGAMYDGETGEIVIGITVTDYKFETNAATLLNRSLLWEDLNAVDRQYYWSPTIYEVNGQEPSISELMNPGGNMGGGTVWNTTGNDINYITGNVGIGTMAQSTYKLAVNGDIHTKEVKVDLVGWADYVFSTDYNLPTLKEVEQHIKEKGHLINIPSAEEVKANGIELGEMNKLFLEKIEELTLYILEQQKEIKKITNRIEIIEQQD